MDSITQLYRIGSGPSSSHTMGPVFATQAVLKDFPQATSWRVYLYDSLAKTGKGHMTDSAILHTFGSIPCEIVWCPNETLPEHPNGLKFEPLDANKNPISDPITYYSVGGGTIRKPQEKLAEVHHIYPVKNMADVLEWCEETGSPIWQLVRKVEGPQIWDQLSKVWKTMQHSIVEGLEADGVLPGGLKLSRRAHTFYLKAKRATSSFQKNIVLASYALAVAEYNASAGTIVTAPTCGASGVLPATLRFVSEVYDIPAKEIHRALATAGLVGNIIKFNASISGAEAGCQAEIGAASAMAAAAAAQLLGGTPRQIEYAAEMGLEHHLGLTCDPVNGLVQIPCIERNAFAAMRALGCAEFAVISDGHHRISFDQVVQTLLETGRDMCSRYRETSEGGLAKICHYC